MVFESLVADLLNRYLGEYVENLDKGQLKIGIWGGKIALFWVSSKIMKIAFIDFSHFVSQHVVGTLFCSYHEWLTER